MFEALDENTRMAKVMYWRTCDTKGMGKEQKAYIKQMRTLYSLEEPQTTMDSRLRLAKRNADMRAYVKKEDGRMPKRVKCPYCGYSMLIFLPKNQIVME